MSIDSSIFSKPISKGSEVWVAPNATLIGDITLGDSCTIMFGAVIRADNDSVNIQYRTNIQDNAIIHVDPGCPVVIGHDCIIGHLAIVHGATVGNHVLIGMNSTILNKASIGDFCIIGANTLVPEGMIIPSYSLVVGTPARIIKQIDDHHIEAIKSNAQAYVDLGKTYAQYYNQNI